MGIRFVLLVNKQGQTRLAQYYEHLSLDERRALEGEIVRKCLARTDQQEPWLRLEPESRTAFLWIWIRMGCCWPRFPCPSHGNSVPMQCSFVEHRNYKVVYRRYASLFFLVGVDNDEEYCQSRRFGMVWRRCSGAGMKVRSLQSWAALNAEWIASQITFATGWTWSTRILSKLPLGPAYYPKLGVFKGFVIKSFILN